MEKVSRDSLQMLPRRERVMFALFCAEQVKHLSGKDKESAVYCIKMVKLWLEGRATREQCRAAVVTANITGSANAAYAAVYATNAIAHDDASAIYAEYASAAVVAYITSDAAIIAQLIKAQQDYYDCLLNLDKYAEEMITK